MNGFFAVWLRDLLWRMCLAFTDPRPRERAVAVARLWRPWTIP